MILRGWKNTVAEKEERSRLTFLERRVTSASFFFSTELGCWGREVKWTGRNVILRANWLHSPTSYFSFYG
jgi:hypothetical protein